MDKIKSGKNKRKQKNPNRKKDEIVKKKKKNNIVKKFFLKLLKLFAGKTAQERKKVLKNELK